MTTKEALVIYLDGSHKHGAKEWFEAREIVRTRVKEVVNLYESYGIDTAEVYSDRAANTKQNNKSA